MNHDKCITTSRHNQRPRPSLVVLLTLTLCPAAGCGDANSGWNVLETANSRKTPPIVSRETTWRGWKTIEQSNGLMTLRHVPAIGGRTMSIEINGHDCVLVFPEEQGKHYDVDERHKSVHFGGHYACIGPERIWSVGEQAFAPHSGPYRWQLDTDDPDAHVLKMTSRPGSWRGATYNIARTITMHRGNTHVTVDERIVNRGLDPLSFYLWDFTQIDAVDRTAPDRLRDLVFYVPVPQAEGHKQYTQLADRDPDVLAQFNESVAPDVLAIRYQGRQFKIATHAKDWWVACVDQTTGWTYVKAFDPIPGAQYVDNNGPVEVYGSNWDRDAKRAFVEMELLTGLREYPRDGVLEQREHWYVTTCHGPVLRWNEAGLIAEPIHIERTGPVITVRGRYGVFCLGTLQVQLLDANDLPAGKTRRIPITPRQELILSESIKTEASPVRAVVDVFDYQNRRVAQLDATRIK